MNQRQLEVFLAAVRLGSVTAAAEELFISQPSASYQIRSLEEEFGRPLLERKHRGVGPTEAGQAFLPVARRAVEGMDAAQVYVRNARERGDTRFVDVLHCQVIHDPVWRRFLARWSSEHPDVVVRTTFGTFDDELDFPDSDVYIVPSKRDPAFYPAGTQRTVLYQAWTHGLMSERHPLARRDYVELDDLLPYPALFPKPEFMDTLGNWYWGRMNKVPGEFQIEFHSSARSLHEIQLQLFSSQGVFISQGVHTDLAPGLAMVPFSPSCPRLDEVVCWHDDGAGGDVRALVEGMRRFYSEHAREFEATPQDKRA